MKQIEITVQVNNSFEELDEILKHQGYKMIEKYRLEDIYLTQNKSKLTKNNIIDILNTCVLIRYIKGNSGETKKIIYKIKEYKNNTVISEEKINVNIDNITNAERLFNKLGFEKLTEVKYDVVIYSNNKYEFAFQNVDNLGLLLEFEHKDDFTGISSDEIINEKLKMLEIVKNIGLNIGNDYDIKKAYELVLRKIKKNN